MTDETRVAEPAPTSLPAQTVAALAAEGATLIDVRRTYEFEAGHIAGASNIEMNELSSRSDEVPRDRPVVFYCRTGNRSGMAAEAFRQAGYDAHNLEGGITAWDSEGRALEPAEGVVQTPLPPS